MNDNGHGFSLVDALRQAEAEQAENNKVRKGLMALHSGSLPDELIDLVADQLPKDMDEARRNSAIITALLRAVQRLSARIAIEAAKEQYGPDDCHGVTGLAVQLVEEIAVPDMKTHVRMTMMEVALQLQAEARGTP